MICMRRHNRNKKQIWDDQPVQQKNTKDWQEDEQDGNPVDSLWKPSTTPAEPLKQAPEVCQAHWIEYHLNNCKESLLKSIEATGKSLVSWKHRVCDVVEFDDFALVDVQMQPTRGRGRLIGMLL